MSTLFLLYFLIGLCAARVLVVYGLQFYVVKLKKLENKIYDIDFRPTQLKREFWEPFYGDVLDASILFILYALGLLHFVGSVSAIELLIYLLAHVFLVEPIYYWYHRLLHVRFLYKTHHIYHHWSVIPSPTTSYTFTFLERLSYSLLFAIPILVANFLGYLSLTGLFIYVILFDIANSIGHFNYEIFSKKYNNSKVKWLFYTPTFHAQHHSRFHYNYCLFMPIYDKIFGTYLKDTEDVFTKACDKTPPSRIRDD